MIADVVSSAPTVNLQEPLDTELVAFCPVITESNPVFRQTQQYSKLTGLPFWAVACHHDQPRVVFAPRESLPLIPDMYFQAFREAEGPHVHECASGLTYYSLPLPSCEGIPMFALGWLRLRPDRRPDELVLRAVESGWTKRRLDEWLSEQPYASPRFIRRLLDLAWSHFDSQIRETRLREELNVVNAHVAQTQYEIELLHSLTANLQLSRTPEDLADWCLSRVREMTHATGAALCLEERDGSHTFLSSGEVPFGERELARLCARCDRKDWTRPFVKNRLIGTAVERDIPGLKNFVLCSIGDHSNRLGWLIHCNAPEAFNNIEASLLQSIARILSTHLQNRELFQQHEDLLMSFVRSLVSTIDAKDAYTRGHSERVALVAKCLAEEIGLNTEQLDDIYLSSLLHDIGKVGVDDEILRKAEKLSDVEFEQIKRHPEIGCQILSGLQNLQHVLPGVRHHHEAYDGTGYPDRLKGNSIPLMARIIAVADAYDAMASDRPYRKGMPLEKLERIFQENSGPQWDPKVLKAYFRIRVKIRKLWSAHRPTDLVAFANESQISRTRFFSKPK